MTPNETPRPYSLKPGWICLVLAVLLTAIFGPLGLMIGGPLMLVCVILSIIGMAKDNTGGGIALLLSSVFLVPGAFVVWMLLVAVGLTLVPSEEDGSVEVNSLPVHEVPIMVPSHPVDAEGNPVIEFSGDSSETPPMFGVSAGAAKKTDPEAEPDPGDSTGWVRRKNRGPVLTRSQSRL